MQRLRSRLPSSFFTIIPLLTRIEGLPSSAAISIHIFSISISLRRALAKLDDRDRKLIFLRYFRDKTQTETAAVLGMTQVQVSRREKKVLAAMRSSIE